MNQHDRVFRNLIAAAFTVFYFCPIVLSENPKQNEPASTKKCQELEAGIKTMIWDLNSCNQAQDCVVTDKFSSNFPCPPGLALVNKNAASVGFVVTQIEEFQKSCPVKTACLQHWTITKHPPINCEYGFCSFNHEVPPAGILSPNYKKRFSEIWKLALTLERGMTREEVEKIFKTPDGGLSPLSITRYFEPPEILIEVPYDQTGGVLSKLNRVNGSISIHKGRQSFN